MVGREVTDIFPSRNPKIGDEALATADITTESLLKRVNIHVRRGEIVGLFGLAGAGRTELLRAIYGADPIKSGEIRIKGASAVTGSPRRSIAFGLGLIPEDRKTEGLFLIQSVGCGLLTFLPDKYVFIWILSSIPFYSYLFYSYQNYLLFYEQVENAFEQDIQSEEELLTDTETESEIVSEKEVPVSYTEIIEKVDNWIKTDGYVQQGLTIKELSEILHTNRTYLSAYIKTTYKMTFREWITGLRLEYAKNILKEHPEINIQKLAESSGFLSRSNFIKSFTEKEGCTPAKWKKANLE
jgi:AraC-like DNA-binding protein